MTLLPYILPLVLGRTFDLNKMTVGVDIFPKEVVAVPEIFTNPHTVSRYQVIDHYSDVQKLLGFGNAFSLKVKAGVVNAGALGDYLSDHFIRKKAIEVVRKITFVNVTKSIPVGSKPIHNWRDYGEALGTHYVRSITYGAQVIASTRYETNSTQDKERIKSCISHGRCDLENEEKMRELLKLIKSTQMKVFSSVPLDTPPNDMDSLKRMFDEIRNSLIKFNGGLGIPVRIELSPLEELGSHRDDKFKERTSDVELDLFEYKFEDLRDTKKAISDWMKSMARPLTKEQEQKVGDLYNSVEKALRVFHEVIGSLDKSQGPEQLNKAYDVYGTYGFRTIFYRKYLQLRKEMETA